MTPNPLLNDDEAKLEADRKHDEAVFLEHKRLQEKERKELHERMVQAKIQDLERTLNKKRLELRAIEAEKPSLESRNRMAKRAERTTDEGPAKTEKQAIEQSAHTIDILKKNEESLERQLKETQQKEGREEVTLRLHEKKLAQVVRTQEGVRRLAEEDERVVKRRAEDKKRESGVLEAEIRRFEDDIAKLKREIGS